MSDTYISQRAIIDIPIPTKSERKYYTYNHDDIYEQGYQEALDKAATLPPADVAPVVRCKDCRYRVDPDKCCLPDGMLRSKDSGFCSYGERREE